MKDIKHRSNNNRGEGGERQKRKETGKKEVNEMRQTLGRDGYCVIPFIFQFESSVVVKICSRDECNYFLFVFFHSVYVYSVVRVSL